MAGLKTLLGLFPKTAAFEKNRKQLADEYNALIEYDSSDDLARFKELELYIQSDEFKTLRNELLTLRYNNSEEYKKEIDFKKLSSDKEIKLFLKTQSSAALKLYNEVSKSDKLARYNELDALIKTPAFSEVKNFYAQSGKKRFELSDLGKTLAEYHAKSKSESIRAYQKFTSDKLFKDYNTVRGSDKLALYEELKKYINSSAFFEQKANMGKSDFKASDAGKKLHEYKLLSKSKEIKNYLKHATSPFLNAYNKLSESGEYQLFLDLQSKINSSSFKQERQAIERKTFKDTDEYKLETEYKMLSSDAEIKKYFAFRESKEFANYKSIKDSAKLEKYLSLKEYLSGSTFAEKKKYLTMAPKTRWKQSEPFARQLEFEKLKDSEKIKWYFKTRNHKKFEWLRTWELTFEDEFEAGKLDTNKWITRYYWGNELLNESYSLADEKHCITDGNNLSFKGGILQITTRKEKCEGKIWNPEIGFAPHEFNYTSGLINTGGSFRQEHGLFEAKIKIARNPHVQNAFWMVGNTMEPHINVINAQNKCMFNTITSDSPENKKTYRRGKLASDYFIYSVEWTANEIIWRVNGLEMHRTNLNVPKGEMFINISAGLYTEIESGLPATMDIDWVRCYQRRS
ncbi:MAG: glycoside hydrolase family 16 protein [Bacteroidales bacterium]|nr:glycoside hydrolase family 16 protein [Bacteroidales bacterium]